MKKSLLRCALRASCNPTFLVAALTLAFATNARADSSATSLGIRYTGKDFEGFQAFELTWNAVSNATYGVQVCTNLESAVWDTIDLVTPTGNLGSCKIPPSIRGVIVDKSLFARLVLPQPQIFAVEPAIFPPGAPVDAYVTGQCFASNDVVRVDGVTAGSVLLVSPNQFHGPLPPLTTGRHLVELVRGGAVLSSFTVTCADAFANPELVLQGPPDEPLASPVARKGYDYYKSMSDLNSAGLHHNPYFNVNQLPGEMPSGHERGLPAPKTTTRVDSWASVVEMTTGGGGVSPFSGEVSMQVVDLAIPGRGLDFIWARTYNSRIGRGSAPNGWTFSYDVNIQPVGGDILIHNGTGREDLFKPGTNGIYTCPEFFAEGSLSNNVFKLTHADSGYWEFKPLTAAADAGKLAKIVDRNGNTMALNYDGAGKLTQVVDDLGRTNSVGYDVAGRVNGITDFTGRTVAYQYDGNGDLVSVISPPVTGTPNGNDFPGGKTNSYTYSSGFLDDRENHLLLTARDAKGTITHEYLFQHNQTDLSFLRCISVQLWTNTPTKISYLPQSPTPANGFATLRCVANDPVGNVTAISTDARGRCVKLEEFTGRAVPGTTVTNTANLPIAKLRQTDPASYVTTFSWNEDSLCTAMVMPDGSRNEALHQRAYNQNSARSNHAKAALHNGDVRVIRQITAPGVTVDFDGDGVADATERVWRFDYDDRFGSPDQSARVGPRRKGWDGLIYHRTVGGDGPPIIRGSALGGLNTDLSRHGWDGTIKGRPPEASGISTSQPKIIDNQKGLLVVFCISATDPRGNVTVAGYDAGGNCVSRIWPKPGFWSSSESVESYSYNAYGQLTAITNAADANGRRSVDTFVFGDDPFTPQPEPPLPFAFMVVTDDGPGGLRLTNRFSYDARGNMTRTIDPRGNDWLYTYNALDQCVRVQTPTNITARTATDFYYDDNDNLVQVTAQLRDANDNQLCGKTDHFRANPLRQIVRTESSVDCSRFITNDFVYDGNGQCILALGGNAMSGADPHNTVAFQYDERGMLYRTVDAPGGADQSTTQCDYDSYGNTIRVSEGLEGTPSVTTMEHDGFASVARWTAIVPKPQNGRLKVWQLMQGQNSAQVMRTSKLRSNLVGLNLSDRLSSISDPMGNVTTFYCDANDNLRVTRHFGQTNDVPGSNGNVLLAQSQFAYDGLDRVTTSWDSHFNIVGQTIGDGYRTTSFAYAPNGQCTGVTDDLGRTTAFYYDTAGRGTNITSPNQKTTFAVLLNGNGDAEKCTRTDRSDLGGQPQVFIWTNTFDSLGRCTRTVDNVGNTNRVAYDSRGNPVSVTDANGNVTTYAYDGLSRVVGITNLQSTLVVSGGSFIINDNSRCTSSTDANGNTTTYTYDSLDRLTQTTQADGTHHTLVWSPRSNLISETDANDTVITHTYDANDRCTSNHISTGSGVATTTTFESFSYDGSSRLVAATNDVSSCAFSYDSHDNLVTETRNSLTTASTYDALGNRLSLAYPGGRTLTYAYNVLNRCTNIFESSVSLVSFDYDSPDRMGRIAYANGMRTRIFYDGISGTANPAGDFGQGQVRRILHAMNGGSPQVSELNLKWDRAGNKLQRDDAIFQPAIPRTNTMVLNYDGLDRLVESAVVSGSTLLRDTIYGLDAAGNRTNVTGAASCSGSYTMSSTIPPGDSQMNRYSATPCDTRTYDPNGNLASRAIGALALVSYGYDYAGRIVSVSDSGNPVAEYAYDALGRRIAKTVFDSGGGPPVVTDFYHDGNSVIEERENSAVTATLVRSTGLLDMICENDSAVYEMHRGGQSYFFHTDDQGNALALTTTGGTVAERYDYDDYGAVTFLNANGTPTGATHSAVGNPYSWRGRLDDETGFISDDGGNYYEPQTGRDTSGGNSMRAGISTSRSNIRTKNGYRADGDGGGGPGGMRAGISTSRSNIRTKNSYRDDGGGGGGAGGMRAGISTSRSNIRTKNGFYGGNDPWSGGGGSVFSKEPRNILKTFFETGDVPTQDQFGSLIDSLINYHDDRGGFALENTKLRQEFGPSRTSKKN